MSPSVISQSPEPEYQQEAHQLVGFLLGDIGAKVHLNLLPDLTRTGISLGQYLFLTYLLHEDYVTMGDVAKKMSFCTASATEMIDKLEKLGLVTRKYAVLDRRKIRVSITNKGIDLVYSMKQNIAQTLRDVLDAPKT